MMKRFDEIHPNGYSRFGNHRPLGNHWPLWDVFYWESIGPCMECGTPTHWTWPNSGRVCSLECKWKGYGIDTSTDDGSESS